MQCLAPIPYPITRHGLTYRSMENYKYLSNEEKERVHSNKTTMKDVCENGTLNTKSYSSPVPLVGLYIAAASMVCFFLILCDVWAGFRNKKYWFPCRFFSINSITLTLISVAGKLSVDLTSEMPNKQDQLSKLCATVFICVTMCFMLPSVAKNTEFESYANVTALSIFVITVLVNMCMQMGTGVIFNFVPEHAIILIFMLFLLMKFWISVTNMNAYKNDFADVSNDLIRNGKENMIARLKHCYLYAYHSCPQLYASRHASMGDADAVCIMCSIVLVQATLRSFISEDLRFCEGKSDYGWSMWGVVGSQSLTFLLVSIAVGSRWLIVITHFMDIFNESNDTNSNEIYLPFQYLLSVRKVPSFVEKSFRYLIFLPLYIANNFIMVFDMYVHITLVGVYHRLCGISDSEDKTDEIFVEFTELLRSRGVDVVDWALHKGVEDMKRWTEKHENVVLQRLNDLFWNVAPSQELAYKVGPNGEGIQISLLSMMLLVEIGQLVIPNDKVSLTHVLPEVFEITLFIDNRLNTGSSEDRMRSTLAAVIHQYGLTIGANEFALKTYRDHANGMVGFMDQRKLMCTLGDDDGPVEYCIQKATKQVSDFINYQPGESKEVVYGRIEQIFVGMLQAFLAQLPLAVYNHILESPVKEYEDRVKLGLGYMCKIRSVQSHMRFSLPSRSNITSLFQTDTPATPTQAGSTQVRGVSTLSPSRAPAVEMVSQIQEVAQATMEEV